MRNFNRNRKSTHLVRNAKMIMAILACFLWLTGTAGAAGYVFTPLDLGGLSVSQVNGISNTGAVVGSGAVGGVNAGFVYNSSVSPISGYDESNAWGVSSGGTVVGSGVNGSGITGLINNNSFSLPTTDATAYWPSMKVNDSGVVVGSYFAGSGYTGFVYNGSNTNFSDLSVFSEHYADTWAADINNNGMVAGYGMDTNYSYKAFLYDTNSNSYGDVGPDGWFFLQTAGINDSGTIVGYGMDGNGNNSIFISTKDNKGNYTTETMNLSDWSEVYATDINNDGTIVGWGSSNNEMMSFIYTVDGLTVLSGDGWTNFRVSGINDAGAITGWGVFNGDVTAFTATYQADDMPEAVPEPMTLVLLSLGLGALGFVRRRK